MSTKKEVKNNSLDHAKHNSDVCLHLTNETDYYDWIVTTAFYSSLHYIEHRLFPLEINKTIYQSFDEYYHKCFSVKEHRPNKHKVRSKLVDKYMESIAFCYNRLKDCCYTARYDDYNISKPTATSAQVLLSSIEKFCTSIHT